MHAIQHAQSVLDRYRQIAHCVMGMVILIQVRKNA